MTTTLADVLPVAVVVAVQVGHFKGGCPYAVHHFIDVLAQVGYVKNSTSTVQVRINQVCSEAFTDSAICFSLVFMTRSTANNRDFAP
jgi:hypothetical protein